ncbi:hypothetical protein [Candidatus Protofrankia californiensis]|uniref:hypothetical protein n=1 Tax=Candidatus Protofrankia californiensis TaxID=1839754 RepID=UPI0019D30A51|nr:hypothetical protein [Candidatus Protofrankia californiensis]
MVDDLQGGEQWPAWVVEDASGDAGSDRRGLVRCAWCDRANVGESTETVHIAVVDGIEPPSFGLPGLGVGGIVGGLRGEYGSGDVAERDERPQFLRLPLVADCDGPVLPVAAQDRQSAVHEGECAYLTVVFVGACSAGRSWTRRFQRTRGPASSSLFRARRDLAGLDGELVAPALDWSDRNCAGVHTADAVAAKNPIGMLGEVPIHPD